MNLNQRCSALVHAAFDGAQALRVAADSVPRCGTTIVDCGVAAPGGLAAGLLLARVCTAALAEIQITTAADDFVPLVTVHTDHPRLACMASQYAGWEIKGEGFFGMGSGPMRAVAAREPLFADLGYREKASECFGVIESGKLPTEAVCRDIAAKCGIEPENLVLLVAPTRSLAGTLQIVARSVETALHKLHELKFDLNRVESAFGSAPLPPPVADDLAAIGRTNDAILYGGRVTLYCRGDDASLAAIGPQIPSSASRDYGRPFAETLAAHGGDFYKVDPLLFSPAEVTLANLDTGCTFRSGQVNQELLRKSFGMSA